MQLEKLNIAIVNATPFYAHKGRYYLAPSEHVSLSQWFCLFNRGILLKPQLDSSSLPDGWISLPECIKVTSLGKHALSHTHRKSVTRKTAENALKGIDLLYARMPNYEGYWTYQVARQMRIPLILEIHGCWESAIINEDTKTIFHRLTRQLRARHADHALKEMADYATAIITIGPVLMNRYAPDSTHKLVSTNHLVPLTSYRARNIFDLNKPPIILYVGDFQRRKGLHNLFHALDILKRQGLSYQMIMIGDGKMQGYLLAYAEQKGFSDRVTFIDRIPHGPKLLNWFKKADLFVLPSIAAEGVPRVTHEAMALGCPVIATNIGSVSWQLADDAGIVIEPGNPELLAKSIYDVLQNPDLRRKLSEKGYARALQYTLEQQQSNLSTFLKLVFR